MSTRPRGRNRAEAPTPDDRIDLVWWTWKGSMVSFSVNYRLRASDGWKEVVRYDTHRDWLHVHRFWREPEAQVAYLEPEGHESRDYTQDFEAARQDVLANWRRYRSHFEQRARGGDA